MLRGGVVSEETPFLRADPGGPRRMRVRLANRAPDMANFLLNGYLLRSDPNTQAGNSIQEPRIEP
jgi:hypothetical protein